MLKFRKHYVLYLLCFLCASGCSHLFLKKDVSEKAVKTLIDAEIVRPEEFKAGSIVGIFPFIPGENVSADENSDRIAAHIVKGMADAIENKVIAFFGDSASKAELVVQGNIIALDTRPCGGFQWIRSCERRIVVEGSILKNMDKSLIAVFETEQVWDGALDESSVMADRLGGRIGRFISSQINKYKE